MCCSPVCCDFLLVLLAVVFPPLPVWIKSGICTMDSFINIALCILGFLPGLFHSWYIISKYPLNESVYYEDLERQAGSFRDNTYHHHHHHTHTVYVPVGYGTMEDTANTDNENNDNNNNNNDDDEAIPDESPPRYNEVMK